MRPDGAITSGKVQATLPKQDELWDHAAIHLGKCIPARHIATFRATRSNVMNKRRRRFKQTTSLHERLIAFAHEAREKASGLPAGHERQDLLKKAGQADTAVRLEEWISSPGSQPPK